MVRLMSPLAALAGATAASCQTDDQNHDSYTGYTQTITYIKRHPDWTREEFWTHWQTEHAPKVAPLATYFNITRNQQVWRANTHELMVSVDTPSDPSWRHDPPHCNGSRPACQHHPCEL